MDFKNREKSKNIYVEKRNMFLEKLKPTYISLKNPKYLEVDNKYISTLLVVDYEKEAIDIIFKELINSDLNIRMNIVYEKLDKYKTIKNITYYLGNSGAELIEGKNNSQDREIIKFSYNDAKYIRKRLQVDNDELYNLYVYITLVEDEYKVLEYNVNKIKGICLSNRTNCKNSKL